MNSKNLIIAMALLYSSTINAQVKNPSVTSFSTKNTVNALAIKCAKSASIEFGVSESSVLALDQSNFVSLSKDCERFRDGAMLLSAALKDSNGNMERALSRINAGPTGKNMQKAFTLISEKNHK